MPCAAARMIPRSTQAVTLACVRPQSLALQSLSLHGRGVLPLIGPETQVPSTGPALNSF